jgi:F0F1-type ATP synthase assembly protein I
MLPWFAGCILAVLLGWLLDLTWETMAWLALILGLASAAFARIRFRRSRDSGSGDSGSDSGATVAAETHWEAIVQAVVVTVAGDAIDRS